MKPQIFYIHGGSAYSDYESYLNNLRNTEIRNLPGSEPLKKWPSSLRDDLGDEYEVFMPSMPNSSNSKYIEWKIWFERHFEYLRDDLILVGWSQGGYFLAKYIVENEIPFTIKALFMVAAPFEPGDFGGEDGGDFRFDTSKVVELAKRAENITILCSKDDFIVPYKHSLKYKEALLKAELVVFEDKNHFLIEEFPELLDKIRGIS